MKKSFLAFKILFMILMLVAVVFTIRSVNKDTVQRGFESLGLQPGNGESPGLHPSQRALQADEKAFNLCPNRIHAVVWSERRKVEEFRDGMKLKWIAVNPAPRELGYMAVEKWLSAHCRIAVKAGAATDESLVFADFIAIRYIDGTELKIERASSGVYRAKSPVPEVFASEDLTAALKELETIAQFD
jgi:hypothetical protein